MVSVVARTKGPKLMLPAQTRRKKQRQPIKRQLKAFNLLLKSLKRLKKRKKLKRKKQVSLRKMKKISLVRMIFRLRLRLMKNLMVRV